MPNSGPLNFKKRCHTFTSVTLTLCFLSLLLGDRSMPCAYWMNTNVLIKLWQRSTLQPSLKICTKLEEEVKQDIVGLAKEEESHAVNGTWKKTSSECFSAKSPKNENCSHFPLLMWLFLFVCFWEMKRKWEQSVFRSIKRLLTVCGNQKDWPHSSLISSPPPPQGWVRVSVKFYHKIKTASLLEFMLLFHDFQLSVGVRLCILILAFSPIIFLERPTWA